MAVAGLADFHQSLREKLGVGGAAFGEFVADAGLALADGAADELPRLDLADGAAGLGGLEDGAGGEFRIEGFESRLGGRGKGGDDGGRADQRRKLAAMIFRELAEFLCTDLAIGQVVFKQSVNSNHDGNFWPTRRGLTSENVGKLPSPGGKR